MTPFYMGKSENFLKKETRYNSTSLTIFEWNTAMHQRTAMQS